MDYHSYTHIFIINRYAGKKNFVPMIREQLAQISAKYHFRYFIFVTKYAGYEKEIVKEVQNIFSDEKLRFYSVGGSGTFRNMINGIEDLGNTEVGFIPYGLTNDFLKMFNKQEDVFRDIEAVITGKIVEVDYIKSNQGIMLNTFSYGFDADIITKLDEWKVFKSIGDSMPYNLAIIWAILFAKRHKYIIDFEGEHFEGRLLEGFFGNGIHLGGSLTLANPQEISVCDGEGFCRIIPKCNVFSTLLMMLSLLFNRYDFVNKHSIYGKSKWMRVRRDDYQELVTNHDGEAENNTIWDVQMVSKGLRLLVPTCVKDIN